MKEHAAMVLKYCIMVFGNMKWGRMETEQLSSHIWQAAYQEALCA